MEKFDLSYKWDYYLSKATLYFIFFYMNSLRGKVVWLLFIFMAFNFLYFSRDIDSRPNTWKDFYEEYVSDFYIQLLICLGHFAFRIKDSAGTWEELGITYIILALSSYSIILIRYFKNRCIGICIGLGSLSIPTLFLSSIRNILCMTINYYLISTFLLLICCFVYKMLEVRQDSRKKE